MWSFAVKLLKHAFVVAGVIVILLAIAVGGARLLLAQLPGYGDQLTAWIAEEVGLDVGFERIDVRFNLRGPEISFRRATVTAPGRSDPFLRARRASVTLDPLALATTREGFISRLTLEGTHLTVIRDEAGRFELQGAPLLANREHLLARLPARVELALADANVDYRDLGTGVARAFSEVELSVIRAPGRLSLDATATLSGELETALGVTVDAALAQGAAQLERWRLGVDLREADFAAVAPMLRLDALPAVEGRGDLRLRLESSENGIRHATATADVEAFALPELAATPEWSYERLELEAEWTREAPRGWTLELDDVALARNDRSWEAGGDSVVRFARLDEAEGRRLSVTSDFVRLEDLKPFLLLLPPSKDIRRWLDTGMRGDLFDLDLSLVRRGASLEYDVTGEFRGLGIESSERFPGFSGLTGEVRADTRSGRIRFASPSIELDWPAYARAPLRASGLHGVVVWRQGRDGLRVVSDDLGFSALGGSARSSLELTFPSNGASPRADIEATLSAVDVAAAKRLVPSSVVPEPVVDWLDTALEAGTARNVEFALYGPLRNFPFDDGDGQLRVTADAADVELEFVEGWPRAVGLDGRVEFVNASFAATGSGRVLGNQTRELAVEIADFRDPVLSLETATDGPLADVLAFIKRAPLIAEELGPEFKRLRVHEGSGRVDLDLALPLLDFSAFSLAAELAIEGGELGVDGFGPRLREVRGRLDLAGTRLTGESIEGVFLDAPVSMDVMSPETAAYRTLIDVEGESTLEAVRRQFDLPFADHVGGQTRWQSQLWIPARSNGERRPFRVTVASNLRGIALRFPPPLEKAPAEPSNLDLAFEFRDTALAVNGNVGASRRFALRYARNGETFEFTEGAVRFGGEAPTLPPERGLTISGTLPRLDMNRWLRLAGTLERPVDGVDLLSAELELAELFAFGQRLGTTALVLRREPGRWQLGVDSARIAGSINVPRGRGIERPQIRADMERLQLSTGSLGERFEALDPRELPGLTVHADEFVFGARELGEVDVEVRPDALGLRLVSFASRHGEMHIDASGSWLTGVNGARTRLAVNLSSTRVASTLEKLGFDPVIEGELADVTASVEWPGPPSTNWVESVDGDVAVRVETGSMLDIEPGAGGRVVGLMSILALPRRLALDFRDVFNKGFVFDEITGDFLLLDGNAYTDNLKLTGPAAEIGVAGRTGLADREYEQQAVVTAEPGNMLPTVGGLIGGPGVGAALLIFTRIFKEPLKGIGRAVYCITGGWEAPEVERLTAAEIEAGKLCAALPPEGAAVAAGLEPVDP